MVGLAAWAATWYVSQQGWQRIRGDIEALVRYEEEAAYNGETNLVMAVQDAGNGDWLGVRRDQLEAGLPAPTPLPMLNLARPAFAVDGVTALDGEFVMAQVRREFTSGEGHALPFTLPQFYRRRGADDWQRTAPPGDFWGLWQDWRGEHLLVRHSERDAAFVAAVAPRLEAWLAEACALWAKRCQGVLPAKLYLSGYVGSLEYDPLSNVEVRVEFGEGSGALAADYFLSVPSPQIAGVPIDAAGQSYLAEYLAVRLIASLADRATETGADYAALTARAIGALQLGHADPGYAALTQVQRGAAASETPAPVPPPTAAPTHTSALRVEAEQRLVVYTVKAGDTLSGIAQRYGVSLEALRVANNIPDPDVLAVGQALFIVLPATQ
jgi:hypothetical protein